MKCQRPLLCMQSAKLRYLATCSFVAFFFLAGPGLLAQSIFNGPRDYPVGAEPDSVVIADFNGDGRAEIATAGMLSATISVLIQNGDGSFQTAVEYAVGNSPGSLQVADVNSDGKLDLLVVNAVDGTISVLLGNGNGTFQTQKVTTIAGSNCCLAVGDFNGDGKPDVATPVPMGQVGTYGFAVALGNGDGTFQSAVVYPTNGQFLALAAADFNNDGKIDLVTDRSVMLGNGNGTFGAQINTPLSTLPPVAHSARVILIADFNQDGNLDIATLDSTDTNLALMLGNGDGTFQVQDESIPATPLAVGDLNGDGKPDLIAIGTGVDAANNLESLLNNGAGTFTIEQSGLDVQAESIYPIVSVINATGKPYVVIITVPGGAQLEGLASVFDGNGDGTFAIFSPPYPAYPASQALTVLSTMAAADFNGDGKPDLVMCETVGDGQHGPLTYELGLLLNTGAGFSPAILSTSSGCNGIATGDFNGDGHIDLATGYAEIGGNNTNENIAILLGNGDGTFRQEVDYGQQAGGGPLATGDFNNDGKLDVLGQGFFGTAIANLSVILGNGDGTFGLPVNTPTSSNGVTAFAIGDFNRDGKLDVAFLGGPSYPYSPELIVFWGNGDGTFSQGPTFSLASYGSLASGDLNGDGVPDLVVGVRDPAGVVVFLSNGDGTFQSPVTTIFGNMTISSIAIADFNLDGKQDIALSNADWDDTSVLLGNGDGTFQTPLQFSSGLGSQFTGISYPIAAADFDGNGSPDLAVEGFTGITLLLNVANGGSGVLLSPTTMGFGSVNLGQSSAAQTAVLNNTSATSLSITSIAVTGAQAGDYQQTNTCGTSLDPGTDCTISITFSPQASGARTAAVQITDSAPNSPQIISLSGTGVTVPAVTFSPSSVSFPDQATGSSSSATPVTLTNTGGAALNVTSVSLGGTNASEFSQTNNCTMVQPSASCTINVTFTPTATGAGSASLIIADNAGTGSQTVALSGTGIAGPDFTFSPASGGSNSQTISAGQIATFNLSIAPTGSFSGTVNLTCAVAPAATPAPVCSVPASVNATGTSATSVTVTVSTTASGSGVGAPSVTFPHAIELIAWTMILGMSGLLLAGKRRRVVLVYTVVLTIITMVGCGGSTSMTKTSSGGTPAGTYTATVTATSGSLSHQVPLTVVVQ